jgi:hypothetical protein
MPTKSLVGTGAGTLVVTRNGVLTAFWLLHAAVTNW